MMQRSRSIGLELHTGNSKAENLIQLVVQNLHHPVVSAGADQKF